MNQGILTKFRISRNKLNFTQVNINRLIRPNIDLTI